MIIKIEILNVAWIITYIFFHLVFTGDAYSGELMYNRQTAPIVEHDSVFGQPREIPQHFNRPSPVFASLFETLADGATDIVDWSYTDDSFHDDVQALYEDLMVRFGPAKYGGANNDDMAKKITMAKLEKDGKLSSMHVAFVLVMIVFQIALLAMIGWFCVQCISKKKDREMILPMYSHM